MIGRLPKAAQWGLLAALSAAISAALLALDFPAALLLGPMFAGIALGTRGAEVSVSSKAWVLAQAVIGCMVANTITAEIGREFLAHWPLFLAAIFATLLVSAALGAGLSRTARSLPGTTAIWGVTPGAATAMVVMAEAYGADVRLVAFMQYLRVIFVALTAAALAHFWLHLQNVAHPPREWFPPLNLGAFAATLAVACAGTLIGVYSRIQAGAMLVPMALMIAFHLGLGMTIELPQWLLAATYALLGWGIGLRFRRDALRYALRALPAILFAIFALIAACAALSWLLTRVTGVDALTAYLAMSPGGMDTVAIIAAASHVDMPFVMAMQAVRLLVVILFGPKFSAFVAKRMSAPR
ncbi:MAG: AbrB family transcriptional regulator [Gallionellaceae bacterium]|jgi:membrane AbrB-like protein|nr:AbrB family transcriptional regulator [Gallionellaceae bacterium]